MKFTGNRAKHVGHCLGAGPTRSAPEDGPSIDPCEVDPGDVCAESPRFLELSSAALGADTGDRVAIHQIVAPPEQSQKPKLSADDKVGRGDERGLFQTLQYLQKAH